MKLFKLPQKPTKTVVKKVKVERCDDCFNDLLVELRGLQLEREKIAKDLHDYQSMSPNIFKHFYKLLITMERNGLHLERGWAGSHRGHFEQNISLFGAEMFERFLHGLTAEDLNGVSDELVSFICSTEVKVKLQAQLRNKDSEISAIKQKLNIL